MSTEDQERASRIVQSRTVKPTRKIRGDEDFVIVINSRASLQEVGDYRMGPGRNRVLRADLERWEMYRLNPGSFDKPPPGARGWIRLTRPSPESSDVNGPSPICSPVLTLSTDPADRDLPEGVDAPPSLIDYSESASIAFVTMETSLATLRQWSKTERRNVVKQVIGARLQQLGGSSQ